MLLTYVLCPERNDQLPFQVSQNPTKFKKVVFRRASLYNDRYIISRGLTSGEALQVIPPIVAGSSSTDPSVLTEKRGRRGVMLLTRRLVWRIGIDEWFEERSYKQTAIAGSLMMRKLMM